MHNNFLNINVSCVVLIRPKAGQAETCVETLFGNLYSAFFKSWSTKEGFGHYGASEINMIILK